MYSVSNSVRNSNSIKRRSTVKHRFGTQIISNTNSVELQQFFNRLMIVPALNRQSLYRDLIDGLVNDGVWSSLDILYIYAAANVSTAMLNIISSSFTCLGDGPNPAQWVADRYWILTPVLHTQFLPATAAGHFSRNSAMAAVWTNTSLGSGIASTIINGGNSVTLNAHWNDNNTYWNVANTGQTVFAAPADNSGFWLLQRTASNARALYQNDVLISSASDASIALSNAEITIGQCTVAYNVLAFACGSSLVQAQRTALYTRIQTYLSAVGVI